MLPPLRRTGRESVTSLLLPAMAFPFLPIGIDRSRHEAVSSLDCDRMHRRLKRTDELRGGEHEEELVDAVGGQVACPDVLDDVHASLAEEIAVHGQELLWIGRGNRF